MADASAHGFQVFRRLDSALLRANLVICATGNGALDKFGFAALQPGTAVATVTSSDDELVREDLDANYIASATSGHIIRYDEIGNPHRHFLLINDGNAPNFIHGAVIGPAIQLIEAEKLIAAYRIANRHPFPLAIGKLAERDADVCKAIAEVWNEHFLT